MSKPAQYLLTLDFSYPCNIGERTLALNIAKVLKNIQPNLKVICGNSNIQKLGYNIIKLKSVGIEYIDTVRIVRTLNTLYYDQGTIHLININYSLALPLLRKRWKTKVKLIPYFYMLEHSRYLRGPRNHLKSNIAPKLCSRFADLAVATSPLIFKRLKMLGFKNVYSILPPIDTQIFKPLSKNNARKELERLFNADLNFNDTVLTLLYMGHLTPDRFPYMTIFKILRKLIKMNIILNLLIFTPRHKYNVDYSKNLLKTIKDLEIKKHVFLQVKDLNTKEKIIAYNVADVFVYPALKPSAVDPPLTILEALSCGIPVISTKVQSIPYIVTNCKSGFLINKINELSNVITLLYKNKYLLNTISEGARRTALNAFSNCTVKSLIEKIC